MKGSKNQKTPDDAFPAYVDSLKQAVAELERRGVPCSVTHLQAAKKALGKPAFAGTRVHFGKELFGWLDGNPYAAPLPEDPGEDALEEKPILERRKLKEQYLAARKRRLILDGEYESKAQIRQDLAKIGAATRSALEGLRADVPSLEGLPAADIDAWMEQRIDVICRELHDATSKLYG